jgi:hypothetical protein
MVTARHPYPSDVSDDEWAFVAPNLTLLSEDAHVVRRRITALASCHSPAACTRSFHTSGVSGLSVKEAVPKPYRDELACSHEQDSSHGQAMGLHPPPLAPTYSLRLYCPVRYRVGSYAGAV